MFPMSEFAAHSVESPRSAHLLWAANSVYFLLFFFALLWFCFFFFCMFFWVRVLRWLVFLFLSFISLLKLLCALYWITPQLLQIKIRKILTNFELTQLWHFRTWIDCKNSCLTLRGTFNTIQGAKVLKETQKTLLYYYLMSLLGSDAWYQVGRIKLMNLLGSLCVCVCTSECTCAWMSQAFMRHACMQRFLLFTNNPMLVFWNHSKVCSFIWLQASACIAEIN